MTTPSDWDLERLAAGESPPVGSLDEASQKRLEDVRAVNAEILTRLPPPRVAAEVRRRAEKPRRAPWLWLAVPALAAAALLLAPHPKPHPGEPEVDTGTIIKGPPELSVYRQTPTGAEHLEQGATVHPGDVLQLRYVSAGRTHGAVFSIDGAGAVTLHFPEHVGDSTQLRPEGAPLHDAYQLDESPRFERFFFVTSSSPLDVATVLKDARALAARPGAEHDKLHLSQRVDQVDFLLLKANP